MYTNIAQSSTFKSSRNQDCMDLTLLPNTLGSASSWRLKGSPRRCRGVPAQPTSACNYHFTHTRWLMILGRYVLAGRHRPPITSQKSPPPFNHPTCPSLPTHPQPGLLPRTETPAFPGVKVPALHHLTWGPVLPSTGTPVPFHSQNLISHRSLFYIFSKTRRGWQMDPIK